MADVQSKYPLHEELARREDERETVQNFIDWLHDGGHFVIAEVVHEEGYGPEFVPIRISRAELIGQFMGIDAKALSAEKDAMYREIVEGQSNG